VYYNLSVWYKIRDLTRYAAVMAGIGALITLVMNWLLIPVVGYTGSAWAKLICYLVMMVVSYIWGRRIYQVPYETGRMILWTAAAVLIYFISVWLRPEQLGWRLLMNTVLLGGFMALVTFRERKMVGVLLIQLRDRVVRKEK
jgi:O-antigen/teichoic acid export membrane protein